MSGGYFKVERKLFDGEDWLWGGSRAWTRVEAWLDLIQMAAYRDGAQYASSAHGTDTLARGEFVASLRYLGKRWSWDKMKVSRFCLALEKAGRVARQREGAHGTVYLIVKYEAYQGPRDSGETVSETPSETAARQRRDKEEEGKKDKQETETSLGARGAPAEKPARTRDDDPPGFAACWAAYPARPNDSRADAVKAYRARVRAGVEPAVLLAGTVRYAAYCVAAGKAGSEWVKRAATFYGPGGHYLLPWDVPAVVGAVGPAQPDAAPATDLLGALDGAGLTHNGLGRDEYRRRVLDLAPVVGYTPDAFLALMRAVKPYDLERFTFEPDRRKEFARRLAAATAQVGVAA